MRKRCMCEASLRRSYRAAFSDAQQTKLTRAERTARSAAGEASGLSEWKGLPLLGSASKCQD